MFFLGIIFGDFPPIWAGRGAQNLELSSLLWFYFLKTSNCRQFWGLRYPKPETVVTFGGLGIFLFFSPQGTGREGVFLGIVFWLFSLNLGRSSYSKPTTVVTFGVLPPQNLELSSFLGSEVSKT